jgi:PAS domain S-box-containing protein
LLTSAAGSVETHLRDGLQAGDIDAGPVAAPAYWFLNRQGLDALDKVRARVFSGSGLKHGLLVFAADRTTRLGLFAGTTGKGRGFTEAQARLAQGILNLLLLAVERIRGQQEHQSRLKRQIEQAKRDWEAAVDALPQIICVLRQDGSVSRVNRAIEAWKLGSVKAVRSETLHDLLHPHCSDWSCRLRQGLKHAMDGLGGGPSTEFEVEDRPLSRYLRIKLRRSQPDGRPDRPGGELYALAVVEDISEQKRAERTMAHFNEELKIALQERTLELTTANAELRREVDEHIRSKKALAESEQKYEFIVQNTLTGIFLVRQGKIAFCNKQFQHIFGYDDAELEHMPIERLIRHGAGTRPSNVTPISGVAASIDGCVCKGIRKGRREIWVRQSFTEINRHGETIGLGAVVDITDQVNAESELEASREELQVLSSQLLCSQEEERKRIAVELHDSVGQSLSAIKLSVEQALDDVERAPIDRQQDKLAVVVRRIRDTIEEVRRISMDLRPAVLDDFGATAALEWLCRELQSVFPAVRISLEADVDEALIDDTLKVAIFRIVQEALHNAFKHAASERVSIRLGSRARLIRLSIQDNGRGFDLEKAAGRRKGLGLGSMKERAKLSGGTLEVTSGPGRGTLIEASWPV